MQPTSSASSKKFILVVDDDQACCELLADGLASFGYLARTTNSSSEALEIVKRGSIRLVLTDISMLEADAFELLRSV